jgi:hypothetical protein
MATTPNFNWSTPDNTGLVKNGALDIRTLGNSIDASLVDLKGGTTGQVLAKASNTDMDFVWAADAGAPTSLGFSAGKNKIINGDFGIWQRGTSFTPAVNTQVYNADRFYSQRDGSGTVTVSQQTFTPGTAPVAGYEGSFFYRFNQTVAGSGGTYSVGLGQKIEDVRTFAGQTITLSFWAKADSAWASPIIQMQQNFGSGGSTAVNTTFTPPTYSTSWARYLMSVTVPSVSGKTIGTSSFLSFEIWAKNNATQTLDIWGMQVEAGSVATAFQTATGTIQGELAACMRYYQVIGGVANAYPLIGGYGVSGTSIFTAVGYPVPMRTTPTIVKNGTWGVSNCGQPAAIYNSFQGFSIQVNVTSTGNFFVSPDSADDTFTNSAEL